MRAAVAECPLGGARTSPWGDDRLTLVQDTPLSHEHDVHPGCPREERVLKHKVFAALSALALMGSIAACGSDSGSGSGSGGGSSSSSANKDPLKVALIPPS